VAYLQTGAWCTVFTCVGSGAGSGQFTQWDQDAHDPAPDIQTLKVENGRTAFNPNRMGVDYATHGPLTNTQCIKDRIKYGAGSNNPAVVNARTLAALFEVEEYVVGRAVQTTSPDGAEVGTTDYIMQPGAVLVHA